MDNQPINVLSMDGKVTRVASVQEAAHITHISARTIESRLAAFGEAFNSTFLIMTDAKMREYGSLGRNATLH